MNFEIYPQKYAELCIVNAFVSKATHSDFETSIHSLHDNGIMVTACFDTGATNTIIKEEVVQRLGLTEVHHREQFNLNAGDREAVRVKVYEADIFVPGINSTYLHLPTHIVGATCGGGLDLLIGMDVISRGDFSLTRTPHGTLLQLLRFE